MFKKEFWNLSNVNKTDDYTKCFDAIKFIEKDKKDNKPFLKIF
jgi:hypothetical protein